VHRDESRVDAGLHVAEVIEELALAAAQERDELARRLALPIADADQHVAPGARPGSKLPANARHATRNATRVEHHGQVERFRVGAEIPDVRVVEVQAAECTGPLGALARGIELMDRHPGVGLAGGELRGADGSRQPSARMFPTLRDELFTLSGLAARYPRSRLFARLDRRWADPEAAAEVDWIPGAFVFIRAQDFAMLGGFDERFFMYYEEVDLCRRLRAAGRRIQYWPELKAMHIGGASAKTVKQARVSKAGSQLESWRMRSGLLYYRKHHGAWGAAGLYALERGWHKLRERKAHWRGRREQAADFGMHCAQLVAAWRDTAGGTRSPAGPW